MTQNIKCIKCLAKDLSIPNAFYEIKNGTYECQCCKSTIPVPLLNNLIRDKLSKRVRYLKSNAKSYIQNIVKQETNSTIDVPTLLKEKSNIEESIKNTFEAYMALELFETDYKAKIKEYTSRLAIIDEEIKKAENLPFQKKMEEEISAFLAAVQSGSLDIISDVLYDIRTSKIEVIFKFEERLNLKFITLPNLIPHEGYTARDFKIDEILLEYIKKYPSLKIEELKNKINLEYHNLYTYTMIKKSIQRLTKKGLIEMDGNHKKYDGYRIKEPFNQLSKRDKITLHTIHEHPELSMAEIGKLLGIYPSSIRARVQRLKELGLIDASKYAREPYLPITTSEKETIVSYVLHKPTSTTRFLSKEFKRDRSVIRKILSNANIIYSKEERQWMKQESPLA